MFRFSFSLLPEQWFVQRGKLISSSEKNTCEHCDSTANITATDSHHTLENHGLTEKSVYQLEFEQSMPLLTSKWFIRRGRLASKNRSRTRQSQTFDKRVNEKNRVIGVKRGEKHIEGTIEDNAKVLEQQIENETNQDKRAELYAIKAVAMFLMEYGPIISTQLAGKVHRDSKNEFLNNLETKSEKRTSSSLFFKFSRHLDIQQIYIQGKAYIVENRVKNVEHLVKCLKDMMPSNNIVVNNHLQEKLEDVFQDSLRLLDTKRDRDILKGIFANATSIKFTAKLQGVKNRTAIANCRAELCENIEKFHNIERTSLVVSNAMTNEQQRLFTRRVIQKRKQKEFKCKLDSRGRMLKCEQWKELANCLEYIFDNQDVTVRAGEGLETHPRLKNEIRFRSKDNNTFMRQACHIITNISPPSFNISLSSCCNYTMTYKENSAAARRHHHGMGVNAKLSLRRPSHTKVDKLVINLHYSSANVNYLCDYAAKFSENVLVDSKDAKKIVCGDITPVQKPGRMWKVVEYPDHDWNQSRTNAVTPMTHLFLRTDITHQESQIRNIPTANGEDILSPISDTVIHITRTGRSVTVINPSLLEPETTFRLFHEVFLLLTKPSLDKFF